MGCARILVFSTIFPCLWTDSFAQFNTVTSLRSALSPFAFLLAAFGFGFASFVVPLLAVIVIVILNPCHVYQPFAFIHHARQAGADGCYMDASTSTTATSD